MAPPQARACLLVARTWELMGAYGFVCLCRVIRAWRARRRGRSRPSRSRGSPRNHVTRSSSPWALGEWGAATLTGRRLVSGELCQTDDNEAMMAGMLIAYCMWLNRSTVASEWLGVNIPMQVSRARHPSMLPADCQPLPWPSEAADGALSLDVVDAAMTGHQEHVHRVPGLRAGRQGALRALLWRGREASSRSAAGMAT